MPQITRYKLNIEQKESLKKKLVDNGTIPELFTEYVLYLNNENQNYPEINLIINPKQIIYKFIGGKSLTSAFNKEFELNPSDIFSFIRSLSDIGYKTFVSGEAFIYNFEEKNVSIKIYEDSLIGTFLFLKYDEAYVNSINNLLDKFNEFEKISLNSIKSNNSKFIPENILSDSNSLNSKILNILHINSIPLKKESPSLNTLLSSKSNDYSIIEKGLLNSFNVNLNGSNKSVINLNFFIKEKINIIIPSFNSEKTILRVLDSIESQDLTTEEKKQIEVIIIDDGSANPLINFLHDNSYSFKLIISRSETNQGLAKTRNIGIGHTSYSFITIFLDTDILIPKNYIKEHYLRHKFVPNGLFVSFKENIDEARISLEEIKMGLPPSKNINDSRIYKFLKANSGGIYHNTIDQDINILEETDYFKNFGYGRIIGNYNLATMVIGHNMSIRTSQLKKIGNFSTEFKGWGLEDSYFGATCIANNMWVIPVLSSNVYHLNHPPRSGSKEIKIIEFEENLKIYNNLIEKPFKN
jgi:glycosyltransferase involved in cell wall biosynthesis